MDKSTAQDQPHVQINKRTRPSRWSAESASSQIGGGPAVDPTSESNNSKTFDALEGFDLGLNLGATTGTKIVAQSTSMDEHQLRAGTPHTEANRSALRSGGSRSTAASTIASLAIGQSDQQPPTQTFTDQRSPARLADAKQYPVRSATATAASFLELRDEPIGQNRPAVARASAFLGLPAGATNMRRHRPEAWAQPSTDRPQAMHPTQPQPDRAEDIRTRRPMQSEQPRPPHLMSRSSSNESVRSRQEDFSHSTSHYSSQRDFNPPRGDQHDFRRDEHRASKGEFGHSGDRPCDNATDRPGDEYVGSVGRDAARSYSDRRDRFDDVDMRRDMRSVGGYTRSAERSNTHDFRSGPGRSYDEDFRRPPSRGVGIDHRASARDASLRVGDTERVYSKAGKQTMAQPERTKGRQPSKPEAEPLSKYFVAAKVSPTAQGEGTALRNPRLPTPRRSDAESEILALNTPPSSARGGRVPALSRSHSLEGSAQIHSPMSAGSPSRRIVRVQTSVSSGSTREITGGTGYGSEPDRGTTLLPLGTMQSTCPPFPSIGASSYSRLVDKMLQMVVPDLRSLFRYIFLDASDRTHIVNAIIGYHSSRQKSESGRFCDALGWKCGLDRYCTMLSSGPSVPTRMSSQARARGSIRFISQISPWSAMLQSLRIHLRRSKPIPRIRTLLKAASAPQAVQWSGIQHVSGVQAVSRSQTLSTTLAPRGNTDPDDSHLDARKAATMAGLEESGDINLSLTSEGVSGRTNSGYRAAEEFSRIVAAGQARQEVSSDAGTDVSMAVTQVKSFAGAAARAAALDSEGCETISDGMGTTVSSTTTASGAVQPPHDAASSSSNAGTTVSDLLVLPKGQSSSSEESPIDRDPAKVAQATTSPRTESAIPRKKRMEPMHHDGGSGDPIKGQNSGSSAGSQRLTAEQVRKAEQRAQIAADAAEQKVKRAKAKAADEIKKAKKLQVQAEKRALKQMRRAEKLRLQAESRAELDQQKHAAALAAKRDRARSSTRVVSNPPPEQHGPIQPQPSRAPSGATGQSSGIDPSAQFEAAIQARMGMSSQLTDGERSRLIVLLFQQLPALRHIIQAGQSFMATQEATSGESRVLAPSKQLTTRRAIRRPSEILRSRSSQGRGHPDSSSSESDSDSSRGGSPKGRSAQVGTKRARVTPKPSNGKPASARAATSKQTHTRELASEDGSMPSRPKASSVCRQPALTSSASIDASEASSTTEIVAKRKRPRVNQGGSIRESIRAPPSGPQKESSSHSSGTRAADSSDLDIVSIHDSDTDDDSDDERSSVSVSGGLRRPPKREAGKVASQRAKEMLNSRERAKRKPRPRTERTTDLASVSSNAASTSHTLTDGSVSASAPTRAGPSSDRHSIQENRSDQPSKLSGPLVYPVRFPAGKFWRASSARARLGMEAGSTVKACEKQAELLLQMVQAPTWFSHGSRIRVDPNRTIVHKTAKLVAAIVNDSIAAIRGGRARPSSGDVATGMAAAAPRSTGVAASSQEKSARAGSDSEEVRVTYRKRRGRKKPDANVPAKPLGGDNVVASWQAGGVLAEADIDGFDV